MLTVQIDIPTELEPHIRQDAERAGVDLHAFVTRRVLEGYEVPAEPETEGTLYDRLKPYIGLIPDPGYPPTTARDAGEQFTDYLVEKKRQGRL